jgi:hypothetical protein
MYFRYGYAIILVAYGLYRFQTTGLVATNYPLRCLELIWRILSAHSDT